MSVTSPLASSTSLDAPAASPWRLILASTSPRRAQLLQSAGVPFVVARNDVAEPDPTPHDEAEPSRYVERLARDKAAACDFAALGLDDERLLILSADTIVWHRGRILNKPRDFDHACEMLASLRGQRHQVFTGVCLRRVERNSEAFEEKYFKEKYFVAHDVTSVHFRDVSDAWIARYVATGEPMDKAGAYAAQGLGAVLIDRIEGDFFNVVGLPLARLARMLEEVGAPIELWWNS